MKTFLLICSMFTVTLPAFASNEENLIPNFHLHKTYFNYKFQRQNEIDALLAACSEGFVSEIIEIIGRCDCRSSRVNEPYRDESGHLKLGEIYDDLDSLKFHLLETFLSPNNYGEALIAAITGRRTDLARHILSLGSQHISSNQFTDALIRAAKCGNKYLVELLLTYNPVYPDNLVELLTEVLGQTPEAFLHNIQLSHMRVRDLLSANLHESHLVQHIGSYIPTSMLGVSFNLPYIEEQERLLEEQAAKEERIRYQRNLHILSAIILFGIHSISGGPFNFL